MLSNCLAKKNCDFILLRLPIFKKILIGISKSKNPTDILLDIIYVLEGGIEENKKNMKPRKEENSTKAEEERTKEEEVYEPSASGESDPKSQKDERNSP